MIRPARIGRECSDGAAAGATAHLPGVLIAPVVSIGRTGVAPGTTGRVWSAVCLVRSGKRGAEAQRARTIGLGVRCETGGS